MSWQLKLQILRLNGWTDERVSTTVGDTMGAQGPSAMTVYRWRTGRTKPAKVYQGALERLFDNEQPTQDKETENVDSQNHE